MQNFFKRDTCRLCKSRNLELVIDFGPTPTGDDFIPENRLDKIQEEFPLELSRCLDCGLLQIPVVIHQELVYGDYIYETASSLGLDRHFQHYASEVIRRINPKKGALVIDIGSNDGTLLKYFQKNDMRVLGVDPARQMAKRVTASGIETLVGFFSADFARKVKKDYGQAAIITANNVFANIDDLDDFVAGVKELLGPDSVFIIETGYMIDSIQNRVFDNFYHEHLSYFSVKPLEKFFKDNGLELIDVERVATKGGSIRCTVQLKGAARPVSPAVAELMTLEKELGFDALTPFRAFVENIESVKDQLKAKLREIKAQGKEIVGYGASVGATTMVYYFDLKDSISFFIDDNPMRQGLYSPGLHLPVLSPESIYEKKPSHILLLAWRYADPIIKKHKGYLEQGGSFIKFLPTVEIASAARQDKYVRAA